MFSGNEWRAGEGATDHISGDAPPQARCTFTRGQSGKEWEGRQSMFLLRSIRTDFSTRNRIPPAAVLESRDQRVCFARKDCALSSQWQDPKRYPGQWTCCHQSHAVTPDVRRSLRVNESIKLQPTEFVAWHSHCSAR